MYTVGFISKLGVKTRSYSNYEEALKKYKEWAVYFSLNNSVNHTAITTNRDDTDSFMDIKTTFTVDPELENYTVFLSKNEN